MYHLLETILRGEGQKWNFICILYVIFFFKAIWENCGTEDVNKSLLADHNSWISAQ